MVGTSDETDAQEEDKKPSNFELSTSSLFSISSRCSLQSSSSSDTIDNATAGAAGAAGADSNNNHGGSTLCTTSSGTATTTTSTTTTTTTIINNDNSNSNSNTEITSTNKKNDFYVYTGDPPQLKDYLERRVQHVKVDESMQKLPAKCFARCFGLKHVDFSNSNIQEMGDEAFSFCRSLQEISIPSSLPHLPYQALSGCGRLKEVVLQDGLQSIGMQAFQQCSKLQTIELPSTINQLGNAAFKGCYDLQQVIFRDSGSSSTTSSSTSTTTGTTSSSTLQKIPAHTFCMCHSLTEIELPPCVEELGDECFSNCVSLQTVKQRKQPTTTATTALVNVKVIGHGCFLQCMSLKDLFFSSPAEMLEQLESIGEMAFEGCGQLSADHKEIRATRKMSRHSRESIRKSLMIMPIERASTAIAGNLVVLSHQSQQEQEQQ